MGILTSTVAQGIAQPAIGGALVYRKSSRGVVKLAAIDGGQLSSLERHLLIMVDGRRTLAELSELFGSEEPKLLSLLAELEAKGLVKRVDASVAGDLGGAITQFGAGVPEGAPATGTRARMQRPGTASGSALAPRRDARPQRFYPPAVITPRREPAPPGPFAVDEHPLSWFVLVLTLTIAGSNWLAHRVHSELSRSWWSDYKQTQPIDPFSGSMSTASGGGGRSDG